MELELTVVSGGGRRDVIARLDDGATVGQLRRALGVEPGPGIWRGDRFLDGSQSVRATGIRSGELIGLDRSPPPQPRAATRPVVLAAVGGLDAGGSADLGTERAVAVGRLPDCELRLRDGEVSRRHAGFRLGADGRSAWIADLGSRNGVGHRGTRLEPSAALALGEPVRLGESLVEARRLHAVAADLTDDGDGTQAFNRPPHFEPVRTRLTLVVPAAPAKPSGVRIPWAAALVPLVLAGLIYLLFPRFGGYLIVMMLLSPVLLVANAVTERRGGRKSYRSQLREYEAARQRFEADLAAAAREDERTSRQDAPDPAELVRRATARDAALWQRRRSGKLFLEVRVGLHDRPARVTLQPAATGQAEAATPTVYDVPVTVDLRGVGVLGIAAPREALLAAARAAVVHIATLHTPGDVALAVLTGTDTADDWAWATWLPHSKPLPGRANGFACRRLVATDGEQAAARVAELLQLVDERTQEQHARLAAGPSPGRAIVVLVDGARRMRAVPGISRLLATGPAAGVYAICLDDEETALPDECGATVVAVPPSGSRARVRIAGHEAIDDVLLDGIGLDRAEQVARVLTPVRALGDADADRELPDAVRFTELASVEADPKAVTRRWAGTDGGRSSKALLGMSAGGPVVIDLVKDGPHALVAGTSGSGKSELLQTLVASLALANRPDALNFVLVDYKGGSAFAACSDLPHCAGLITDLDGHLVRRALDSLSAELKRREMLFAEVGAKDIADYWARTGAALPRLVIVVDEFASLIEEVPEFVPGVVGLGMRGRSLGVHVVLATQRPGGVVSADMRANLNLRICLRVTSEAESSDVIDSAAAARITPRQPGRAYVRAGHSDLTRFQAARVGWPLADQPAHRQAEPAVTVTSRRTAELGLPLPAEANDDVDAHGYTDLTRLVEAICAAADEQGMGQPRRPWLPPLADAVPYDTLPPAPALPSQAVIGLVDRPAAQAQDPFAMDLDKIGPVVIAGTVRSGRSTALRTLAAGLATTTSPEDLHLYVLDCGNHALAALSGFPHCGAVVDGADHGRVVRLLAMVADEIARRQRAFMSAGFGSLAEQRQAVGPGERLPHVVVLLDRLESFVGRYQDVDGGTLIDRLETLLRTGPAVGVTCVLATDRTGITHRIGSAAAARLVLRQATTDDLLYFGVDHKAVPSHMPPGRAIWTPTGEEVQLAYLGADPSGTIQLARLRELAEACASRWRDVPAGRHPRRLDALPEVADPHDVEALRRTPRQAGPGVVTLGVGGDHLHPVDVDLAALGGSFVVCGPGRSGRSTALCSIVASLDGSLPLIVVAPRPSPLREFRGAAALLTSDVSAELPALLDTGQPCVLVVDDAELVDDLALQPVLEHFARSVRDHGSLLIAAATTEDVLLNRYRGWLATARRDRNGLLLNPTTHVDGEVFDVRLPRSTAGGWPPGRALLVRGGDTSTVQITDSSALLLSRSGS